MACTPQRSAEIGELAGARLGAARAESLLAHLEGCTACSQELDLVADLLHAPRHSATVRTSRFPRRVALVALAAAAAAVLLFFLRSGKPEPRLRDLARLAPPSVAGLVLRGGAGEEPRDAGFERALERLAAGDAAQAGDGFAALLAARPDDPLVLFYLGLARLQHGELAAAIDALGRAEELGTGFFAEQALWYRAQAHLAREEGAAAHALLLRLIELDGDYEPNARAQLAEIEPLLGR